MLNNLEYFFIKQIIIYLKKSKNMSKIFYLTIILKNYRQSEKYIYYHKNSIFFWKNFSKKYFPIKNELILEELIIIKEESLTIFLAKIE